LNPFPTTVLTSQKACSSLGICFGTIIESYHRGIDASDEAGDAVTADLLTQSSATLEKYLWQIESHLAS
jgi:starvation-inducible DNA-binding protein